MWNIKEEDLYKFRMTCNDRLSPEGATGFMFGGILYSSIAVFLLLYQVVGSTVWFSLI